MDNDINTFKHGICLLKKMRVNQFFEHCQKKKKNINRQFRDDEI